MFSLNGEKHYNYQGYTGNFLNLSYIRNGMLLYKTKRCPRWHRNHFFAINRKGLLTDLQTNKAPVCHTVFQTAPNVIHYAAIRSLQQQLRSRENGGGWRRRRAHVPALPKCCARRGVCAAARRGVCGGSARLFLHKIACGACAY